MKFKSIPAAVIFFSLSIAGCQKSVSTEQSRTSRTDSIHIIKLDPKRVLVDASRDGGVWWFPQIPGGFSDTIDHQGKLLADWLTSQGYQVDELPRDTFITSDLLAKYNKVIRAGGIGNEYAPGEIKAYEDYLKRGGSLLLLQDHLKYYSNDGLSESLGVKFSGIIEGTVDQFAVHDITTGVTSFPYIAGSAVTNALNNPNMTIIGSFNNNYFLDLNKNGVFDATDIVAPPVMGILNSYPKSRIFFMGEINELENVPQPFTQNLFDWLFQ